MKQSNISSFQTLAKPEKIKKNKCNSIFVSGKKALKIFLNFSLLIILSFGSYGQTNKKEKADLTFYDTCLKKMINPKYKVETFPDYYYQTLTVYVERGDLTAQYITSIKNPKDTIRIPKILFAYSAEKESEVKSWKSVNCEEVCEGTETEFYSNGNKSLEGVFKDGKPIEVKNYDKEGKIITHAFYKNLTLDFDRVDFFDEEENLIRYKVYKKGNTVIKTYSAEGDLIEKEKRLHN